eukprot:UN01658
MAQPKITPQQMAQAQKMIDKMQNGAKAGKIIKGKTINDEIKTFKILNLSHEESTISDKQFPEITNMNEGKFIVSDADEELLFLIEFKQEIQLDSITFYALQSAKEDEYSPPRTIQLFKVDSLNIDFDDAKDTQNDAEFVCKKGKLKNGHKFSLKKKAKATVKFSKVTKLLIYISSNIDQKEQTYLNGIQFRGTVKETTDMAKLEEVCS